MSVKPGFLSHLKAILLPFAALVVIPAAVLCGAKGLGGVWAWAYPDNLIRIVAGSILTVVGLFLLVSTIRLFATLGGGTLAPWEPPRRLIVVGPYRYVRNPMISSVLIALLGEAVLFGSLAILSWCVLFFIVNIVYFRFSEEPGLVRRFGDEYVEYRKNVPAWLLRLTPWTGSDDEDATAE